jgi:hypothetical protein
MAADSPPNYIKTEEWINTGSRDIMIFYPSMQEMVDFSAYIKKCEDNGAVKASGICKVSVFRLKKYIYFRLYPQMNGILAQICRLIIRIFSNLKYIRMSK